MKKNKKLLGLNELIYWIIIVACIIFLASNSHAQSRPGACNTGPSGTLTPATVGTITVDGTVIENVTTGPIKVQANNVTIRNCLISGGTYGIDCDQGDYTGILIEDCEIVNSASAGILGSNFTARRCNVHDNWKDAFKPRYNVLIESCWTHHLGKRDSAHADAVQMVNGNNTIIRGNFFEGPVVPGTNNSIEGVYKFNAALMVDDNPEIEVLFENNWVDGGNYCINFDGAKGCPSVTVINNHFSGQYKYGVITSHGCGATYSGNIEDPELTSTIPGCGSTTGTTVNVTGIDISLSSLNIEVGAITDLDYSLVPSNASNQNVVWSSSDTSVATINSNGLVTAISAGSTTITVTSSDGGFTATCNVAVYSEGTLPANVALNKPVIAASGENAPSDLKEELVDGNTLGDSRWSADGFPQWAIIDLQGIYDLSSIEVVTYQDRDYQYIVEASLDNVLYTTIVDRSTNTEGTNLVDAVTATAGYLKITVSGANSYTGTWVSINELIAIGTASGDGFYCDPINGSMANAGTQSSPWSSLQDVFDAGKTFADGETIYLMNGNHGFPVISESNNSNVTITKAEGHNPVIQRISFSGASNWLLKDVEVSTEGFQVPTTPPLVHPVYPIIENSLVQISNYSSYITISDCYINSVDNSINWSADDWNYKAWTGVYHTNTDHITVKNCLIKNINFGIHNTNGTTVSNTLYEYNTIENFTGDGLRGHGTNTVIQYNTVKNCYATNGNHRDMIQVVGTTTGLILRGNKFIAYTDPNQPFKAGCQGIALFNGMYYDFIIENNIVFTDHYHGITLLGAQNCKIVNNTVIDMNDNALWIQIGNHSDGTQSTGNIIRNNLCSKLNNDANIGDVDNNLIVPYDDRNTYFADFTSGDLSLKSGCGAIDAGIGTAAPSIDIDGNPRPLGNGYDIGAYEYNGDTDVLPAPWTNGDVGAVAAVGSAAYSNGTFTVEGSGSNIWSSADEFHFVYQQIEGDATITARINSIEQVDQWTKGGVMMRETLDANSINGNMFFTPIASNGSKFSYRATTGVTSSEFDGPDIIAPYWVRLERSENDFTGYVSVDGNTWTALGSATLNMSSTYYIGLSVSSLSDGTLASCVFDNVSISTSQNNVLINEDFSADASNFTKIAEGTWTVSGGRYILSDPGDAVSGLLGNISVHNTDVSGDFELSTLLNVTSTSSAWNDAAVIFNFQNINNYYYVSLNESNDSNTNGIFKVVNDVPAELADLTVTISDNTDYNLEIIKTGADIVVKLDGNEIASVTDATFTGGKVGYGSKNDGCQFDDLLVLDNGTSVIYPTSISLSQTTVSLDIGSTVQLIDTVLPVDASNPSVTWSTSNSQVATVSDGLVTAVLTGTATITATTSNGLTATCAVTVTEPVIVWDVITYDDFENGMGNYKDGGGDCYLYTGGIYAHQGNNAVQIQDNQGAYSSFYYTNSVDLSSYNELKIEFWFYGLGMDDGYDFFVEYSEDGGTTWQSIESYVQGSGNDFVNGLFYNVAEGGDLDAIIIDNTAINFTSNAKLRFRCDGLQNNDQIYIDEISVMAQYDPSKSAKLVKKGTVIHKSSLMNVFPNPSNGSFVKIDINDALDAGTAYIQIYTMDGKLIQSEQIARSNNINPIVLNTDKLSNGLYIISVMSENKIHTKKITINK